MPLITMNTWKAELEEAVGGETPVALGRMLDTWNTIFCVGRHVDEDKMVFIGSRLGSQTDIGVLDMRTGIVSEYIDAFGNVGGTIFTGIDCDRSTGLYVAASSNSQGNFYYSYWSEDLVTWTQCSSPTTQFHGNARVEYEDTHDVWYWQSGSSTGLYTGDGKTFVRQQSFANGFGGPFDVGHTQTMLRAEMNPLGDTNVAFLTGNTARSYRSDPSTYPEIPIESNAVSPYGNYREIMGPNNRVFTHVTNVSFTGGVTFWNGAVYMMTNDGQICKNDQEGLIDTWTQIAEKGTANPDNELITSGIFDFDNFQQIDGEFWVHDGNAASFWKYTNPGEPAGDGWVAQPAGPDNPWSHDGTTVNINNVFARTQSEKLVYTGRKASGFEYWVFYDEAAHIQTPPAVNNVAAWNGADLVNSTIGVDTKEVLLGDVANNTGARSEAIPRNGKVYFEIEVLAGGDVNLGGDQGIRKLADGQPVGDNQGVADGDAFYSQSNTLYTGDLTVVSQSIDNGILNGATGRIFMIAIDWSNGDVWFGTDGAWAGARGGTDPIGDPSKGTDPSYNIDETVDWGAWVCGIGAIGNQEYKLITETFDINFPLPTGYVCWDNVA